MNAIRLAVAVPLVVLFAACGGMDQRSPSPPPSQMPQSTQTSQPTPTPVATTGTVAVRNSSSRTIWYVYLSPAHSDSWGVDQLKSNVLSPGATFNITSVPAGRYDMKVVTESGASAFVWDFAVTGGATSRITFN